MTYLAIDLEMTGLNVKKDHILEIGALRMEDGKPTGEFSALINPHCAVPETITQLTGITQEMADAGEELADVLPRFLEFAGDLPLLGHNLSFDYSFLKQAFVNAQLSFERTGIDTLKLARRFLPGEQKEAHGASYTVRYRHRSRSPRCLRCLRSCAGLRTAVRRLRQHRPGLLFVETACRKHQKTAAHHHPPEGTATKAAV